MSRTKFTISYASSRLSRSWHNTSVTWESLCDRFREPVRTNETVAQWQRMTKKERSAIKDVGGFVGGSLSSTSRSKSGVTSRSLLTLDFDQNVPDDFLDRCSVLEPIGYIVHTTHSHTPEKPRYRLIVPPTRDLTVEEYEALTRIFLKQIDLLDCADTTAFVPNHLMYWPSCPSDGEYVFRCSTGRGLDPDKHLAKYADWRDCTQWPIGANEQDTPRKRAERAEDPTAKGGLVGDFCRVYDVEEVLRMFPDLYEPTTDEGRWSYIPGSVFGGVLVYDDCRFVYNHNETNPAKGLCNAFDLMRIHRFGELDGDTKSEDPTKLPSYNAMLEYLSKDEEFLTRVTEETQRRVHEEFSGLDLSQFARPDGEGEASEQTGDPSEEKPKKPRFVLKRDKKGKVECTIANAVAVLEGDPLLSGRIRYNEFTRTLERAAVPWNCKPGEWTDSDDSQLRAYMERYDIRGTELIADAVAIVSESHRYHPVRDYLDGLPKWDGVERLDTMFIRFLGAEDTQINRMMTRKQMVGAVKRIYEPGCKHDYTFVLSGPEGAGKSTLLYNLAPLWFSDSTPSIEGKEALESLQGVWIIEFAELACMNKAEVEQYKAFSTKQYDIYRAPYGRRSKKYPRQCVFFGTTNEVHFLRGDRGNRRYWILFIIPKLRRVPEDQWVDIFVSERDQIWAEAKYRYTQGEQNWLEPELEKVARQIQEESNESVDDPLEEMLGNMLEARLPLDWHEWNIHSRRRYWQYPEEDAHKLVAKEERKFFCIAEYLREVECLDFGSPLYKSRSRKVGEIMRKKFSDRWEYIGNSREVAGIHGDHPKAWKRKDQNLGDNEDEEDL